LTKSCQNVVKKLLKSCYKVVFKSCQKVVKKMLIFLKWVGGGGGGEEGREEEGDL
jgi:hypothetical protein